MQFQQNGNAKMCHIVFSAAFSIRFLENRVFCKFYQILSKFESISGYLTSDSFFFPFPFTLNELYQQKQQMKNITWRRTSRYREIENTDQNLSVTNFLKLIKLGPIIVELSISMFSFRNPLYQTWTITNPINKLKVGRPL